MSRRTGTRSSQRMDHRERNVALLLARAGVKSYTHLHWLLEQNQPGLADAVTIWRYLYKPPMKMDFRIVKAMADALETDADTLVAVLSGDRVTLDQLSRQTADRVLLPA